MLLAKQSFPQEVLNSKGLKLEDTDDEGNNGLAEINKDNPNENKQRLFILNSYSKKSQPPSLCCERNSKAARGVGKLYSGEKEKLWMCSDWRVLV